MWKSANTAKTKWNTVNYTQVKVSVDPEIASAFKSACAANGTSMARELSRFMFEYGKVTTKRKAVVTDDMSTRRKRRRVVAEIINRVEMVKDSESASHKNVPENLRGTDAYEAAEETISVLDEVIELLGSIY